MPPPRAARLGGSARAARSVHNRAEKLARELPDIRRELPGFEDFAMEGRRGIEPDRPTRSLLFHALPSPNVVTGVEAEPLGAFPSLAQIDAVENYVFGVELPSVEDLVTRFPHAAGAVAVFATKYRPGAETVHRRHADLCFSRTGVVCVGTAEPLYDSKARGFVPFDDDDQHAFRVLPARYVPYIAVHLESRADCSAPSGIDSTLCRLETIGMRTGYQRRLELARDLSLLQNQR